MATMFNVSEKQWTKVGLPAHGYKKIKQLGWAIVWKQGGGFTLQNKDGTQWGLAKIKNNGSECYPDHVFKSKYAELIGQELVIDKTAVPVEGKSLSDILAAQLKMEQKPKPESGVAFDPSTKAVAMAGTNLTNITEVGVLVPGTDNPYKVYLLSDDCNIAYRYHGGKLSLRTEKMSNEAKKALAEWGLDPKTANDGRKYASTHLSCPTIEMARRTLGSLAASVLTGPPVKLLSKDQVV